MAASENERWMGRRSSRREEQKSLKRVDLPLHNMRPLISNNTLRRLRQMRSDGKLIAHRPAHDQQARFMSRQISDVALQVVRDRILTEDIVEEAGVCNGAQHGSSRRCDDIA